MTTMRKRVQMMEAAGVDLYEALKPLIDYMRNNGGDEAFHDADGTGWLTRAEQAIAKAEGTLYLNLVPASDGALRSFIDEVIDDMPDRSDYTPGDVRARFSIAIAARGATKSDGGVEGHAISGTGPASEQSRQPETPIAGIESGPSEATQPEPEAVTVEELAEFLDDNGMLSSHDGEIHIARRILSRFDVRRR